MSEIIRELTEEEQKFFGLNYQESSFCYGIFQERQFESILSIGKPEDNRLKYQYEILNFQGNEKDFEFLWKKFLEEHSCHSCICRLNLSVLENLYFKKIKDFYSYYPFSVVYRVDDLTDGKFYVGMCEVEESWNDGYTGSGGRWGNHKNVHKDHKYKRTILKENFSTPLDTRSFELQEIEKVFYDENNCNMQIRTQGQDYFSTEKCPECDGKHGTHRKGCSKYKEPEICPECGGLRGQHKKECSKCNEISICPECGGRKGRHYATCSEYKKLEKCPECDSAYGQHKTTCSHYNEIICSECGGKHGNHKKTCSQCKQQSACPECGVEGGSHKKTCSRAKKCQYCGTPIGGFHKKDCPLYEDKKSCPECGGKNGTHKKDCSFYKERKVCKICGRTRHLKGCPNSTRVLKENKEINKCSECGFYYGKHSDNCSKNIITSEICPECGGKHYQHKKDCSKNKSICPECGKTRGNHEDWCSKAIICSE